MFPQYELNGVAISVNRSANAFVPHVEVRCESSGSLVCIRIIQRRPFGTACYAMITRVSRSEVC
jgi:hypothetical protein